MPIPQNPGHHVKRIVLPSGKTMDVVYFSDAVSELERSGAAAAPKPAPPERSDLDLHICRQCASELVFPTAWEETKPRHWLVALRCPECEWLHEEVFAQEVVDRFDEQLDLGTETLMHDLRRLTAANMAEEIERFVSALDVDAIVPMDF